jgi:hypothetical protein
MEEKQSYYMIIAIVAIVAVVAIIIIAKNSSNLSPTGHVITTADTIRPTVQLINPIQFENYLDGKQISIRCNAQDDVGLSRVELWLRQAMSNSYVKVDERIVSGTSANVEFLKTYHTLGTYVWTCKAFDTAQNYQWGMIGGCSAAFKLVPFGIISGPQVQLVSPLSGTFYTNTPISFTCSGSANQLLAQVEFAASKQPPEGENPYRVIRTLNSVTATETFTKTWTQPGTVAWNCKFTDVNGSSKWGGLNGQSAVITLVSPPVCSDSDGGNNIYVNGTTSLCQGGICNYYSDQCYNATLREYYCGNSYTVNSTDAICPSGYTCRLNKCAVTNPNPRDAQPVSVQ